MVFTLVTSLWALQLSTSMVPLWVRGFVVVVNSGVSSGGFGLQGLTATGPVTFRPPSLKDISLILRTNAGRMP